MLACLLVLAACNYSGLPTERSNAALLKAAMENMKGATSYHLSAASKDDTGDTTEVAVDVDAENERLKGAVTEGGQTTQYVELGSDLFTSEDGGKTFARNEGASAGKNDPLSVVGGVKRQLDGFRPEEADKAGKESLRDGSPVMEQVEGVVTKHMIAGATDMPSLAGLYDGEDLGSAGTVEMWVEMGSKPTLRRVEVEAGEGTQAGVVFEWSKLDEPLVVEKPANVEMSNVELIKKAAANMQDAGSYALKASITMDGQTFRLDGQVDIDNDLTKMDIDESGLMYKLINIDGDVYLSSDYGWTYTQDESGEMLLSGIDYYISLWDYFTPDQLKLDGRPLRSGDPRIVTIDGVRTRHIVVESSPLASMTSSGAGSGVSGKLDLWVSTGDKPYVYQLTMETQSGSNDISATLNWRRFNERFDIAAPPANRLPKASPTTVEGNGTPPRMALDEFKALYDDPAKRPLILDVRSKELYAQGHIPGAVSFPESEMDARVGELPRDRLIIAYCQ
jgi:hypothetical protein